MIIFPPNCFLIKFLFSDFLGLDYETVNMYMAILTGAYFIALFLFPVTLTIGAFKVIFKIVPNFLHKNKFWNMNKNIRLVCVRN